MRLALDLGTWLAAGALLAAGCGRIGIDLLEVDAAPDVHVPACPPGTTPLAPGAATCIEVVERGSASWIEADARCRELERRLCTDGEWALACTKASGLVDMFDDQGGAEPDWEWTADVDNGVAKKRGYASCEDTSSHGIDTDPYAFRCCAPKS